jgi:hypothetical protein
VDRNPAAIDADRRSLDAGGAPDRAQDLALELVVGFEVALADPAGARRSQDHPGVLAGAVVEHAPRSSDPAGILRPDGQRQRTSEGRLREPARPEHPPDSADVHRLRVVRSADDRHQVVRERDVDPPEGHRSLERLHRRTSEHRMMRIADRGQQATLRVAHGHVSRVDALLEPGAQDTDQRGGGGHRPTA